MPSHPVASPISTEGIFDPNKVLESVQTEAQMTFLRSSEPFSAAQKDLDWILNAPELLDLENLLSQQQQEQEQEQEQLSIRCFSNPGKHLLSESHLVSEQRRLGLYAEDLLSAYFSNPNSPHILIARNLQIQNNTMIDKRTIGEFDFLIQERASRRYQHIEMACKFYLGLPVAQPSSNAEHEQHLGSSWQNWVGPNCNDRLDIKMRRFIEHQLLLSQNPTAKARLAELAIAPVDSQYLLRGRLFYPAYQTIPEPKLAGSKHLRGLWLSYHNAEKFLQDISLHWNQWWFTQLHKLEFMAPRPSHCYHQPALSSENFLSYLHEHFNNKKHSYQGRTNGLARPLPLVIYPNENNNGPIGSSELRVFIVPDHWIDIASKQIESSSPL